jgi:hypothetical protein
VRQKSSATDGGSGGIISKMNNPIKTLPLIPSLGSVAIAAVCLLAVSPALNAGDRTGNLINEVSQFINKTVNGVSQNQPISSVRSLPGYVIALGNPSADPSA